MSERIYLDHNATTPVDPRVLNAMMPYFTEAFGNAASIDHDFGHEAKKAVDKARVQIAKTMNAFPDEIIFTSGATESNNLAIIGVAERQAEKGNHIITCVTEHKAVLDCIKYLEQRGFDITYLPVDSYGSIDLRQLEAAITPQTILVSIMAANNEIGTIAPLTEIGKLTRSKGVFFHTDATQALGNIPLDVQAMNIDLLSCSAHKLYGPKGIGALFRRRSNPRVVMNPILHGGGHEKGLRSGTLNVPGIVGFGEAAAIALNEMNGANRRYQKWGHYILNSLKIRFEGVQLNGHQTNRLMNNWNIFIPGIESKALIVQLKDVAIATGSACTSTSVEPSHVIMALGFGEERAHSSIRIGLGRFNTEKQIELAITKIISAIHTIQSIKV
jgi:cysteine desulfurase